MFLAGHWLPKTAIRSKTLHKQTTDFVSHLRQFTKYFWTKFSRSKQNWNNLSRKAHSYLWIQLCSSFAVLFPTFCQCCRSLPKVQQVLSLLRILCVWVPASSVTLSQKFYLKAYCITSIENPLSLLHHQSLPWIQCQCQTTKPYKRLWNQAFCE